MTTLAEVEAAAEQLPQPEQQDLMLFLARRLRMNKHSLPPPREFTREQIDAWIQEDEVGYRRSDVNLFLDASVLLAASGSATGASRALFSLAEPNGWTLTTSPYTDHVKLFRSNPLAKPSHFLKQEPA